MLTVEEPGLGGGTCGWEAPPFLRSLNVLLTSWPYYILVVAQ